MKIRRAASILVILGAVFIFAMSTLQYVSELYLNGFAQRKWIAFSELMTDFHRLYGNLPKDIFDKAKDRGLVKEERGEISLHFGPHHDFTLEYDPKVADRWLFRGKPGQHLTIQWKAGDPEPTIISTISLP